MLRASAKKLASNLSFSLSSQLRSMAVTSQGIEDKLRDKLQATSVVRCPVQTC